jgi:hypothetical protein
LCLFVSFAYAKSDSETQKKLLGHEPHFSSPIVFKSGEYYEITKVDITRVPTITSMNISVKGVKLGDTRDEVVKILGRPDEINEMGIYFYKGQNAPLFAVVFDSDRAVRRIVLFPEMASLAVGNTKKILSSQITTDEELRYYLLGVEDDKIKSPTGRLTFRYLKEGFEFTYVKIGSEIDDFMFFLKYPAKLR